MASFHYGVVVMGRDLQLVDGRGGTRADRQGCYDMPK